MANTPIKILNLPEASESDGSIVIPVVQGGVTKKITLNTLIYPNSITATSIGTAAVGESEIADSLEASLTSSIAAAIDPAALNAATAAQVTNAINLANTAQAAADGKIQTFYQITTPTPTGIGDIWINADTNELRRSSNGTSFDQVMDVVSEGSITGAKIQANSITATQISSGTIDAIKISAASIDTSSIVTDVLNSITIDSDKIGSNTILSANIKANNVTANEIAANSVNASKITANTIAGFSISASQINTGFLNADRIENNSLTAQKISAVGISTFSLDASQIVSGSIDADRITAGSITADKLDTTYLTSFSIEAGSITANEIAANSINSSKIIAGSITANEIAVNTVTTDLLAANIITAREIDSCSITASLIDSDAITTRHIGACAVTATNIATGSIGAGAIVAGAIGTQALETGALLTGNIKSENSDIQITQNTNTAEYAFNLGTQGFYLHGPTGTIIANTMIARNNIISGNMIKFDDTLGGLTTDSEGNIAVATDGENLAVENGQIVLKQVPANAVVNAYKDLNYLGAHNGKAHQFIQFTDDNVDVGRLSTGIDNGYDGTDIGFMKIAVIDLLSFGNSINLGEVGKGTLNNLTFEIDPRGISNLGAYASGGNEFYLMIMAKYASTNNTTSGNASLADAGIFVSRPFGSANPIIPNAPFEIEMTTLNLKKPSNAVSRYLHIHTVFAAGTVLGAAQINDSISMGIKPTLNSYVSYEVTGDQTGIDLARPMADFLNSTDRDGNLIGDYVAPVVNADGSGYVDPF